MIERHPSDDEWDIPPANGSDLRFRFLFLLWGRRLFRRQIRSKADAFPPLANLAPFLVKLAVDAFTAIGFDLARIADAAGQTAALNPRTKNDQ